MNIGRWMQGITICVLIVWALCVLAHQGYKHLARHPDHRVLFALREVQSTVSFAAVVCFVGTLIVLFTENQQ